ncbi:pentapeptide repeat-containing protein, partial [Streptomyces bottropensis]|uniref:pentapeptide repeat-containing protein n=1 Tax=Streptomyces bottropensis TaxID=42235 RepID=UPI0036D13D54
MGTGRPPRTPRARGGEQEGGRRGGGEARHEERLRFRHARFREARFRRAPLREVRLREARFRRAPLREVRLRRAPLREVRLREAPLREVRLLRGRQHVRRRRGRQALRRRREPRPGRQAVQAGRRARRVRPAGDTGARRGRAGAARQERQAADAAVRAAVGTGDGVAAGRRRADRGDAGARRDPHGDHQGPGRELLQGPHRERTVRPRAVLLADLRVPRHRRPADLRQAGPGGRRLAERRAELHARRHGPRRPAVRPGRLHPRRVEDPLADPQGGRPHLGRRRVHPPVPAAPARRRPHHPRERGRLRLPDPGLRGHGLPEEGREGTGAALAHVGDHAPSNPAAAPREKQGEGEGVAGGQRRSRRQEKGP